MCASQCTVLASSTSILTELCAVHTRTQVSQTGFVRKVGSSRLINVICSESGHLQADWESKINGTRKHFKRFVSKMVYVTHHGAIGKDSKGQDLKVDHVDEDAQTTTWTI
jgi:hypothetical protein